MKGILGFLRGLLEGFANHEFEDQRVLKEEKKELHAGLDRYLSGNLDEADWVRFLGAARRTEFGNSVIRFCDIHSSKRDLQSLKRLKYYFEIDASTDEIEEVMKRISLEETVSERRLTPRRNS